MFSCLPWRFPYELLRDEVEKGFLFRWSSMAAVGGQSMLPVVEKKHGYLSDAGFVTFSASMYSADSFLFEFFVL